MQVRIYAIFYLLNAFFLPKIQGRTQNVMVYGESTTVRNLDPFSSQELASKRLAQFLFDSLFESAAGNDYASALATDWVIKEGGTKIIIDLRKDVKWHSGHLFTSSDVVATISALIHKKSNFPNKRQYQIIHKAVSEGRHKVKIFFKRAVREPRRLLTFKILSKKQLQIENGLINSGLSWVKKPIGTGPYLLEKINSQGEIVLSAYHNYFRGAPKIKKIIMKPFSDRSVMAQALLFGGLDLSPYVSPRDLGELAGDQNLQLVPYDAQSFAFLGLNCNKSLLRDRRVRMALSFGINKKEMLDSFFMGQGRFVSGPFAPSSWAYNIHVKPVAFDLIRAAKLLESAGFKKNINGKLTNSKNQVLSLDFVVPITGESETIKRVVLAIQSYYSQIGVELKLRFLDWMNWKSVVLRDKDYDVTFASWSFDDSSNIASLFHSDSAGRWGNNFVNFKHAEVDQLLNEAQSTNDVDLVRAIYQKLHAIIAHEAPYVFLWNLSHHAALHKDLRNTSIEPFYFFSDIHRWRMQTKIKG